VRPLLEATMREVRAATGIGPPTGRPA
jgi:hypothetical protein